MDPPASDSSGAERATATVAAAQRRTRRRTDGARSCRGPGETPARRARRGATAAPRARAAPSAASRRRAAVTPRAARRAPRRGRRGRAGREPRARIRAAGAVIGDLEPRAAPRRPTRRSARARRARTWRRSRAPPSRRSTPTVSAVAAKRSGRRRRARSSAGDCAASSRRAAAGRCSVERARVDALREAAEVGAGGVELGAQRRRARRRARARRRPPRGGPRRRRRSCSRSRRRSASRGLDEPAPGALDLAQARRHVGLEPDVRQREPQRGIDRVARAPSSRSAAGSWTSAARSSMTRTARPSPAAGSSHPPAGLVDPRLAGAVGDVQRRVADRARERGPQRARLGAEVDTRSAATAAGGRGRRGDGVRDRDAGDRDVVPPRRQRADVSTAGELADRLAGQRAGDRDRAREGGRAARAARRRPRRSLRARA